jgi:hypothetical protein
MNESELKAFRDKYRELLDKERTEYDKALALMRLHRDELADKQRDLHDKQIAEARAKRDTP